MAPTRKVVCMSDAVSHEPQKRKRSRLGTTLRALIRTRVTAGVITVLPILITIWVIRVIFVWMRDASRWAVIAVLETKWSQEYVWKLPLEQGRINVKQFLAQHPYFDWLIAVLSVLLTIFILYVIGLFAANIVGRRILDLIDRIVARVPMAKTVYRALKQILGSFAGDQAQSYQRVALVPFPDQSMRAVGFITNVFRDSVTGEELCSVFIATTPNPTTGYLQILRRGDITELNWSVEEAIRTVMSAGILKPDFLTIVANRNLPSGVPGRTGPAESLPPPPSSDGGQIKGC